MLKEILKERDLLPILKMNDGSVVTVENWRERRAEMLDDLQKYSYGYTPDCLGEGTGEVIFEDKIAYAGKVTEQHINITFNTPNGPFTFYSELYIPNGVEKPPVFLNHAFRRAPDRYLPIEEITDQGFALFIMVYTDVVNDNLGGDFSDGMGKMFGVTHPRQDKTEWGKIGMWSYAASRALDYLLTRDDIDAVHTAVVGHSRLGKTALWTAAQDERFWCAISNDSGYGGAATSKHGTGEKVDDFLKWGSWDWFCENFKDYQGKEDDKPYDQAHLIACIAPRLVCVGSAVEDWGADPVSEFLTTLHASSAWELLGEKGLITPDKMPEVNDHLTEGNIGYHLRAHRHFFSREDWNHYIKFLKSKL